MLNVSRQPVRPKPNLQAHGVGPADMTFLQFRLVEVQCIVVRLMQEPHTDQLTMDALSTWSPVTVEEVMHNNLGADSWPTAQVVILQLHAIPGASMNRTQLLVSHGSLQAGLRGKLWVFVF